MDRQYHPTTEEQIGNTQFVSL